MCILIFGLYSLDAVTKARAVLSSKQITESQNGLYWETLKITQFQLPCHEQGHLAPAQDAPSPVTRPVKPSEDFWHNYFNHCFCSLALS